MKEITIIYRDGSDVGLGVLDETGRKFLHIRFIKNAGQGGTELAEKAVEILIGDVEIIDGYDYQALIAFQDRNRAMLEWRGRRQVANNAARIEAMEGVERKVSTTMRKWDKENQEPTSLTRTAEEAPPAPDANGTIPRDPHELLEDGATHGHGSNFAEHSHNETYFHGMKHLDTENPKPPGEPEPINTANDPACPECGMLDGYHGVDCSHAEPDEPEDPINTEAPPEDEQEPLTDFRRPVDAPTEEEAQEAAPVGADDVDVPF